MAKSQTFKELLFGLVKQVKLDMEKQFAEAKIKVTPLQYGILGMLRAGTPTLNELAEKLGVRPPSLVPPIDSLVKSGFVRKKLDKKDRRKIRLLLSPKAHKIFEQIRRDHPTDTLNIAFNKLSKVKQKQLLALLKELTYIINLYA